MERQPADIAVIAELWEIIGSRIENPSEKSYVSRLARDEKGIDKVLEKVGEEATEFILAVKNGIPERTTGEAADLLFHLLVALRVSGCTLDDLTAELRHRRQVTG